ncbi:MAG TPA: TetR/AcrR family transcriptional regulator [Kofleriaceae bacterium]
MTRVLDASVAELARSGYAAFRMETVADAARVNKTSIYRRWPSRPELVAAAVARMTTRFREVPLPDTGSLETDLIKAFTRRFTFGRQHDGRAWSRLLAERHSSEVESIIGDVVRGRAGEWREMLTRAVARGDLPARTDTEILLELVRYAIDGRVTTARGRLDATWLRTVIRTIVAGARAGTLVPPTRSRRG